MSVKSGGRRGGKIQPLEGAVSSVSPISGGLEVVVRVTNPNDRALHYIGAPRAILYDPVAKLLTVRLSDQGRAMVPGGLSLLPTFRVIDPNSDSEIRIVLPETIVRLADTPSPAGDVAVVEHHITDADELEVAIAWAETPFYQDPRDTDIDTPAAVRWQQGEARIVHKLRDR